ncbi:Uncharacterized protein DB42_AQ00210 [Neochlamydia sp. EPS4]|uniref:GyrI-like domain-containing protein n=1 Tax=Neochlamydia sp. EPS4 TaxID=1478175 RepID=UPI000582C3B6|nr:GyrI-like domain-containing protein [Neochlamydia sp. EPS4]KIC75041.1 Uncharacterized protein DB42_AQ00210 [Neochlamydia sp. EPS4]
MRKTIIQLSEIKLVGITSRTNNSWEKDPSSAKISPTIQRYFQGACSEKILYRAKPGTTYCVYTDYESDFNGDYTYFIGEEVNKFDAMAEGFSALVIPAQNYVKFISNPGTLPSLCINMWQEIWSMSAQDLDGEREYLADFEIYDDRASDHQNAILDIYIGIKSENQKPPCT